MRFYVGLHHPNVAGQFPLSFISINSLRGRRSDFPVNNWIMDSGAFTEISTHGRYRTEPAVYAAEIERWRKCGTMELAVCQDWMCEPLIIEGCPKQCRRKGLRPCHPILCTYGTLLSVAEHQQLTVDRYDTLRAATDAPLMPVLQGFKPGEYIDCLALYGDRLSHGMRVGVGSICKRNSHPAMIEHILGLIKSKRPDLRLHAFGIKLTALCRPGIRGLLYSADSMAWSFAARKEGRDANDWREAKAYSDRIEQLSAEKEFTLL